MSKYKIADVVFDVRPRYEYFSLQAEDYLYTGNEPSAFDILITDEEILFEKSFGISDNDAYLESLAIFRKICTNLIKNFNGIIFHCSAICVSGRAYLFTAPSGTGKSTHSRLWKECFKDKVIYINDDKPILRLIEGEIYVYGTPWRGKHRLGSNIKVKVDSICKITRSKTNFVKKMTVSEMIPVLLRQTLRFESEENMDKLLNIISEICLKVNLYEINCNMEKEAAFTAYKTLVENKDEN